MKNIHALMKGSQVFKKNAFKKHQREFEKLVLQGQSPKVLFIGCCDSRVLPNLITNTGPGELFIVRNIGNFVAPYGPDEDFHSTAAAIEYAVSVLEVDDIIVCGHSQCGAITALYKENSEKNQDLIHINKWLDLGRPAKKFVQEHAKDESESDKYTLTEEVSVLFQLENLMTYPAVERRVTNGKLSLHGWHYDIESGEIFVYSEEQEEFIPLVIEL